MYTRKTPDARAPTLTAVALLAACSDGDAYQVWYARSGSDTREPTLEPAGVGPSCVQSAAGMLFVLTAELVSDPDASSIRFSLGTRSMDGLSHDVDAPLALTPRLPCRGA